MALNLDYLKMEKPVPAFVYLAGGHKLRIMKNPLVFTILTFVFCLMLTASAVIAQNCALGSEVTAPAGGTVTTATTLKVYNSQETGPNSAAARTTVDTYDDAWRAGVSSANIGNGFFTVSNAATPQQTVSVPQTNAFNIFALNISYDYRDFQLDYRTTARPCIGSQITTPGERVAFLSKDTTMQTVQAAPRPSSLYSTANQPLVYDEIEASSQPNRNKTANAVVFTFSTPVKAFGAWFGDVETRTTGDGNPAIVRFLDSAGNRIGSDVLIQPRTTSQSSCGDDAVGCGNQTTRWIGFVDATATARVKQMVLIVGYQGGSDSCWADQRISFIGPTVPITTTAATTTIGGQVRSGKSGVRNAIVSLISFDGTETRTVKTNTFGYYQFSDIQVGSTYLITVSAKGLTFMPDTQVFTLLDQLAGMDFVAQE